MSIECRQLSPKNIINDILRSSKTRQLPNNVLLEIGLLFGFNNNAMRVAINRLMNSGEIEKVSPPTDTLDEFTHYQLSPSVDPLSHFADEWRSSNRRIKPWQTDSWLLCHLPKKPDRTIRSRSFRALNLLGFRPGPDNLWLRPDNLSKNFHPLFQQLQRLGLEQQASLIATQQLSPGIQDQWLEQWDSDENHQTYQATFPEMTQALIASQATLQKKTITDAMVESFRLGSSAIHLLIKDPLSPDQLCDTSSRQGLCSAMLEYDQVGRKLWLQQLETHFRRLP